MEDYDREDDDREVEEPIDGMLALRLSQVEVATRKGMLDRAFPVAMAKLQALGFVEHKAIHNGYEYVTGYAITELGRAYIIERKRRYPNE